MESPKLIHEKLKRIDNIEDVAYERLFKNYLILNLRESDKLIDIESTDQESVVNKRYQKRPVPGMIYTFINVNKKILSELYNYKTGKTTYYHDISPILFCTSFHYDKNIIKGINLNLLPSNERIKFFEAYYNHYKNFLKKIEQKTEYNLLAINKNYQLISLAGKNPELFKYFNDSQKTFFEYAYRSYKIVDIRRLRMIEYEEWKYIPFFNPKQSFKKINLQEIYRTYWDNKGKI